MQVCRSAVRQKQNLQEDIPAHFCTLSDVIPIFVHRVVNVMNFVNEKPKSRYDQSIHWMFMDPKEF